jgi:3-(3-hydroxy-phenyl)propionate hydroxylase
MTEVLIVGAGPTGLVAAIQLRRFGVACRVIDRAAGPATTSRALGCHARTVEVLEDLGLGETFLRAALAVGGARYFRGEREIARMEWEPPDAPHPWVYLLPQAEFEGLLRERLAALGVEVEWGRELQDISQETDRAVARMADGTDVAARWLVGCDGGHSRVRAAAGVAFVGSAYPEVFHLGDLELDVRDAAGSARAWMSGERGLLMIALDERGLWRVFAEVEAGAPDERAPPPTVESFQRMLDERAAGPGKIRVLGSRWLSAFRLQRRQAERYRAGRVFLAGDAAHVFPPFGGQGMNTGIQDAYNLGWKLALVVRGRARPELLDTYHDERHPIAAQLIREVDGRTRFATWHFPLAGAVRDLLLRVLLRSRALRRKVSLRSSELALHYRRSTWLSEQLGKSRGPQAGDRAPDGPWAGGRLFSARDGTRFTLLLFSETGRPPPGLDPALVQVLAVTPASDPGGVLRRRYAAERGALVLVRPDGYVGFRGDPSAEPALMDYLARVFAPRPAGGIVAAAGG